ncbi:Palmitoyltransferase [Thoreauomyces humboldtii]|nr:Palmitoyltransferase [Thoreauomyces humboldtii]
MAWVWLGRLFVVGVTLLIAFIPITTQYFIFLPWLAFHPNRSLLLYLGPFNLGIASILTNYYKGIFTDPGSVPKNYAPRKDRRKGEMKPRYCKTCKVYKPPRSHHCSVCDRCVLKMDHHCPWLNNCIGNENQPYFLRFVVSVTLTAIYCLFLLGHRVYDLWRYQTLIEEQYSTYDPNRKPIDFYTPPPEGPEIVFLIINLVVLFLLLLTVGILTVYQVRYASQGVTTIESFENDRIHELERAGKLPKGASKAYPYDLGTTFANVAETLGRRWWLWPLPLGPPGDGIRHRVGPHVPEDGPVQWPPKAYFVYRRYPHGRPSRAERERDREREAMTADPGAGPRRPGRVRRGSEGFLVREWTSREREEEVRKALEWDAKQSTPQLPTAVQQRSGSPTKYPTPLVQIVRNEQEETRRRAAQKQEQLDDDDEESTDWSYESSSSDDEDDDDDSPLIASKRPRVDYSSGTESGSDDDENELLGLRKRKPTVGKPGPGQYVDDGAVDAGCTGVQKGIKTS